MNKEILSGEESPLSGFEGIFKSICFSLLFWSFVAALCFFLYSCETKAGAFIELGPKQANYTKPPDKLWHQEGGGFPSEDNMKGDYYRVGGEMNFSKHWSGRASIFDLGKYSQDAITGNEPCFDAYGANAYLYCPKIYQEGYYTEGRIGGLALTGLLHSDLKKAFAFTLEAGPTYVKQSFWLKQSNWPDHTHIQKSYGIGYMVSPGIRLNGFTLNFLYYNSNVGSKSKDKGAEQVGTGEVKVIAAGYVF